MTAQVRRSWIARLVAYSCLLACGAAYATSPLKVGVVVGESMAPTLQPGAVYFYDTSASARQGLQRGDVVVFRRDGETYIKRVVGAPGDIVKVMVSLDPALHTEEVVLDFQLSSLTRLTRRPGVRRSMRLVRRRVPPGCYYVVGDNLRKSQDSRWFGYVLQEQVLGRVTETPSAEPLTRRMVVIPAVRTASW